MITLTEQAALKITELLHKRGRGLGINVGVKTTGCSGLAYVLEFMDRFDTGYRIHESNGIKVFCDIKNECYLQGLVIDWERQEINEGFKFVNPNERDRCGCGESFRV